MKIVTVVGARPQFIKAAVLCRALDDAGLQEFLLHTGQHYDPNMSDVFFGELGIPCPAKNLGIGSGAHGRQTGRMLEGIEQELVDVKPDWLLVYGDTNSTIAGALAASKLHVPVAHVEAGLRSYNRRMPEEINRVLTDHCSDLLFAPTETAVANLKQEGIDGDHVVRCGDVMLDAARFYGVRAEQRSEIMTRLALDDGDYILATVHRAENTDDSRRLEAILAGLAEVARQVTVLWPVHPRTRPRIESMPRYTERLRLIDPVGYLDMVMLEKHARLITTDSGGVQKEAFFHGVPCVTLREETEWVELVEGGFNRLVPPNDSSLVAEGLMDAMETMARPDPAVGIYGEGHAGKQIVETLIRFTPAIRPAADGAVPSN